MDTTYATTDNARLVRLQRHTLVGTDGSAFTGTCRGVTVSKGVLHAMFSDVTGDVQAKWHSIPLANLASPRPLVLGQ